MMLVRTLLLTAVIEAHKFSPRTADPSLEPSAPNADHIALPPATAAVDTAIVTAPVQLLHVFLPGTGSAPSCCEDLLGSSAASGFHTLGLSYEWCSKSVAATAAWCDAHAPGDCTCQGRVHAAVAEGGDLSPLLNVSATSSIERRLVSALKYLRGAWPGEGWGRFLEEECGGNSTSSAGSDGSGCAPAVAWEKVVLSGHSQGAGHATWLGKLRHAMAGVLPLSGPEDTHAACSWVSSSEQATELRRFVPLAHRAEDSIAEISENWAALGIGYASPPPVGCAVDVGGATAGGWDGCALLTSVKPAIDGPETLRPEHCSTAVDIFTPKVPPGALYALEVWPWLLHTAIEN